MIPGAVHEGHLMTSELRYDTHMLSYRRNLASRQAKTAGQALRARYRMTLGKYDDKLILEDVVSGNAIKGEQPPSCHRDTNTLLI